MPSGSTRGAASSALTSTQDEAKVSEGKKEGRREEGGEEEEEEEEEGEEEGSGSGSDVYLSKPSVSQLVPPVQSSFGKQLSSIPRPASSSGLSVATSASKGTTTGATDSTVGGAKRRKVKPKAFFPVYAREVNKGKASAHEDIVDLATILAGQDREAADRLDRKPHLGLFTDRLGAHRCLLEESEHHLSHANMDYHLQMELWRGNLSGAVQMARQRNQLSDWIVAMAPLASQELWELVSSEYADQLEEEGQYHKAVSYLLAGHRVDQAIDLFRRHQLYKEAVSLAKIRLSNHDPILEDLYTEWGQHLMKDGQYEQAAKCYLAMRQIQEAGKSLTKRTDQSSLRTACHVTLVSNDRQLGVAYAYRLFSHSLAHADWQGANQFVLEHPALKVFLPLLSTHELLVEQLSTLWPDIAVTQRPVTPDLYSQWRRQPGSKVKASLPEFLLDRSETDPAVPWDTHPQPHGSQSSCPTLPHLLLSAWHQQLDLVLMARDVRDTYGALSRMSLQQQQLVNQQQQHLHDSFDLPGTLVQTSLELTLCLLSLLMSETSMAIQHLLQAVSRLYKTGHRTALLGFCRLVLPQGPRYALKLQQEFNASRVLVSMESLGDLDKAGGEGHSTIKRYLSEIKEDQAISTASARCRELDCLRAFYYLAIVDFLQDQGKGHVQGQGSEEDGMPNWTGAGTGPSNNNTTSTTTTTTSSSSSSSSPPQMSSAPTTPSQASFDPQSRTKVQEINQPRGHLGEANDTNRPAQKPSQFFPSLSNSSSSPLPSENILKPTLTSTRNPVHPSTSAATLPAAAAAGAIQLTSPSSSSVDPPSSSTSSSSSPSSSATITSILPGTSPSRKSPSPTPLPSIPENSLTPLHDPLAMTSDPKTQGSQSQPHHVLHGHHQKIPKSPKHSIYNPEIISSNSSSSSSFPPPSSSSTTSLPSSSSSPPSHTSSQFAKTPPRSTSPTHSQRQLSMTSLLRLSKGILWDVQAKREALTETLGFIHRAISQHLLANRATSIPQSEASAAQNGHGCDCAAQNGTDVALEEDGGRHISRANLAHPTVSSTPSTTTTTSSSSLSPSLPTPSVPNFSSLSSPDTCGKTHTIPRASLEGHMTMSQPIREETSCVSPGDRGKILMSRSISETQPSRSLASNHHQHHHHLANNNLQLRVEQDLLGVWPADTSMSPTGTPGGQKPRKVLWLDCNEEPAPLMDGPVSPLSRLTPEGHSLPLEWDELPVDSKYGQSYVSLALLRQEQDTVSKALKRVPDVSKLPFPSFQSSSHRLLAVCVQSDHLTSEEKLSYLRQLYDWTLLFAVSSHQKADSREAFASLAGELMPEVVES